jgi:hypothetical protein
MIKAKMECHARKVSGTGKQIRNPPNLASIYNNPASSLPSSPLMRLFV